MPLSITSAFSDPDEFQSALRPFGVTQMILTESTDFRARLMKIRLNGVELLAGTERVSRTATVSVPLHRVLIEFPKAYRGTHAWGAQQVGVGELAIISGVNRIAWHISGPARWGALMMQVDVLTEYVHTILGTQTPRPAPGVTLRRPNPVTFGELLKLHDAAVRHTLRQPEAAVETESARGLEQELVTLLTDLIGEASG
jgi:hypothetical protein